MVSPTFLNGSLRGGNRRRAGHCLTRFTMDVGSGLDADSIFVEVSLRELTMTAPPKDVNVCALLKPFVFHDRSLRDRRGDRILSCHCDAALLLGERAAFLGMRRQTRSSRRSNTQRITSTSARPCPPVTKIASTSVHGVRGHSRNGSDALFGDPSASPVLSLNNRFTTL